MHLSDVGLHQRVPESTRRIIETMERVSGKPVDLAKVLTSLGYRRLHKDLGIVSRIDRPDWKTHMANYHPDGMTWVNAISCRKGQAEHLYRHLYSKERFEIWANEGKKIPASEKDETGYVEIE